MDLIYKETAMSKKARKILKSIAENPVEKLKKLNIIPDPLLIPLIPGYVNTKYDLFLNEKFGDKRTPKNIYELLGDENQKLKLLKKTLELNLSEEEVHEVIKERFIFCYGPQSFSHNETGLEMTKQYYPEFCKVFQITPDEDFPNWKF